jgi:glycosyltransferase involved in cell wall biosynthesis
MDISLITSVPLVPPWDQGDKNLAYTLARALPQHIFRVLTTENAPGPPGANLHPLPLYADARPSLWQKAAVYCWFLLQRGSAHPDIYHFIYRPASLSSCLARLVPAFRQRPTLHTVPATADNLNQRHFFARHLVTLSRHGQRKLIKLGLKNVTHIPTAIPVRFWAALSARRERLKGALGLAGHLTVLFPGHFGPGYGCDVLLQALARIVRTLPRVRFIFACRPRHPADLQREQAVRCALADADLLHTTHFFNTVTDMRHLIGAADLTVLPLETMHNKVDIPTTLLESLAVASPIVISDLPPMNELIHDSGQGAGCLVPPGDSVALADALLEILGNQQLRSEMGTHGQSYVFAHHDVQTVVAQYDQLYREMG